MKKPKDSPKTDAAPATEAEQVKMRLVRKDAAKKVAKARGDSVARLNKTYGLTWSGGDSIILREHYDSVLKCNVVSFTKLDAMRVMLANDFTSVTVTDKKGNKVVERKPTFPIWLASNKRREYEEVVFEPWAPNKKSTTNPKHYNLFRGWGVKPDPRGEKGCTLFLNHLRDVICNSDPVAFAWLIAWLAHAIQYPANRPGTAVLLKSIRHGPGKGLVGRYLGRQYGSHYVYLNDSEQITGKHNKLLHNALLVFGDEITYGHGYKAADKLKSMITDPWLPIEPKFVDSFMAANHMRAVIASNAEHPMPIDSSDRRWFVLYVSEEHINDTTYFDALVQEMEGSGPACLMCYLLEYKIPASINLRVPPMTEEKANQQERSFTPAQEWWYDCLSRGAVVDDEEYFKGAWEAERMILARGPAHYAFTQYVKGHPELARQGVPSEQNLWTELDRLMPTLNPDDKRLLARSSTSKQVTDWMSATKSEYTRLKWTRYFVVAWLGACRQAFERWRGQPIDWDNVDTDGGPVTPLKEVSEDGDPRPTPP